MDSQPLAQSRFPGHFGLADVSILKVPPIRIDNSGLYAIRTLFSRLIAPSGYA